MFPCNRLPQKDVGRVLPGFGSVSLSPVPRRHGIALGGERREERVLHPVKPTVGETGGLTQLGNINPGSTPDLSRTPG